MRSAQRDVSVAEAERLLAAVAGQKAAGREIADLRFGPVTQSVHGARWKPVDARQLSFRNVEWTHGSILGRLLGRARVQECRFERVNLDDFDAKKVDFADCRFEGVTFGEQFLGVIKDCTFPGCSFVNCRFDAVGFVESTLRSCRFEGIKGERTRWTNCLIDDVVMSGKLVKVNFIDNSLRKVDLSAVEMFDCGFLGGKQEELRLPDEPRNFAVDPRVMLAAEEQLREKLGTEALANYRHFAEGASQFGPRFLVNAGVLTVLSPQDREVVIATLYEMRHSASS